MSGEIRGLLQTRCLLLSSPVDIALADRREHKDSISLFGTNHYSSLNAAITFMWVSLVLKHSELSQRQGAIVFNFKLPGFLLDHHTDYLPHPILVWCALSFLRARTIVSKYLSMSFHNFLSQVARNR